MAFTVMASTETTLGQRIRAARRAKAWRQKDLAARIRVEPQTVSNWERGVSVPDLDKFHLLSRELGVPIGLLVDGSSGDEATVDRLRREHLETRRILREGLSEVRVELLDLLERQAALLEQMTATLAQLREQLPLHGRHGGTGR